MDQISQDEQLTQWFSTYGFITAQRVLERYDLILPREELVEAIKSPYGFYHYILKIPLKNILNGIVLQQAHDYHVYVQKLFIDYLLSGESNKDEAAQGAMTRETIEGERLNLISLGEDFHVLQQEHRDLITRSQRDLIKITAAWKQHFESVMTLVGTILRNHGFTGKKSHIRKALNHAFIHCDYIKAVSLGKQLQVIDVFNEVIKMQLNEEVKNQLLSSMAEPLEIVLNFNVQFHEFIEKSNELGRLAATYRTQFYDTILRVVELLNLLPEYKIDPLQDGINKEPLYFDKSIGE